MRILLLVALFTLFTVILAKKQLEEIENVDAVEVESKDHSGKKYTKEHQKSHHHNHKHKKHSAPEEGLTEPEVKKSKQAPIEVPEAEIELQQNLETNKKAIHDKKHAEQVEDLHLQDLTYEENIKKEKKKGHHGAHQAEVVVDKNAERKLFEEQESKHAVGEKPIEDSFEPLKKEPTENAKKNKKQKDKSKNKKKAYEKNSKDKYNKKSKDNKKNKDKKNKKNKEKKY